MKKSFGKIIENNESGFTLVEILIAVTILSIGLLAVATMQVSAITGNSVASDLTEGTTLASDKLESLLRMAGNNYNDPNLLDTTGDGDSGLDDTGSDADFSTVAGKYTIYWNIAIDSPKTYTKTVKVIATWSRGSSVKKVSIQHIISQT